MSVSCDDQLETKANYFTPTIASKYVNTLFSSPVHIEWISTLIYDALELQSGQTLVDMGCGSGVESTVILDKMKNGIHVIGVDISEGMLELFRERSNSNPNIEIICMDAVTFSQSKEYLTYDRILLKSMIHLLTHEERSSAFKGFYKQLAPKNGRMLIISGPVAETIFPFDERTEALFRKGNNIETLYDEIKQAGFKHIEEETSTFQYPPGSIKAEDWIYLIENRAWTLFSEENMNEQQMKDLIEHVKKQFQSPNNFQTIDKPRIIKCYT